MLCLNGGDNGFFGTARFFIGLERLLLRFYDDPAWIQDIFDHLATLYVAVYDHLLAQVKPDFSLLWEDMCGIAGPIISPRTFAQFMLKPYQKVTRLLRDHGVDILLVDTDGDHWPLIPLFLEAGVSGFYPLEARSHMDAAEIRRRYPSLHLQGGIDKTAIAAGKDAIDRELEAKVPAVLSGGYIPHIDHGIPPDVSWENFRYYRRRMDAMLDEFDRQRRRED